MLNNQIINKKILIFGGSGSLGHALIDRYIENNIIVNYSRDECKHWQMALKYKSDKLRFVIGDVRNYNRVESTIMRENPNIIIIACALKHIDMCEYAVEECMATNYMGTVNIVNAVERNMIVLSNLTHVIFISTDKACSPVNTYGMAKSLSEKIIIEKSLNIKGIVFACTRYGNVLTSRGSIIPILHNKAMDPECKEFVLTHVDMTRFIMTLDESVDLIEYTILNAESGDIVIPKLLAMYIKDLLELFSEKYGKPIRITQLKPGEKLAESLINESQAMSMVIGEKYYHIKPYYKNLCDITQATDYNSKMNTLNKSELQDYLGRLALL